VEQKAIQEGIQENGVEDCDKVIQSVLAARHAAEQRDLDNEYAALKKLMVDDAIAKLHDKYEKMANDLSKEHDLQLKQLEVFLQLLILAGSCSDITIVSNVKVKLTIQL